MPSGEVQGANDIYFIRVGNPVAASLDLGDAVLTARIAGRVGNAVRARRTAAQSGLSGAWDLYLEDTFRGLAEVYKDLGPVLEVSYVGGGTPPTNISVTSSGGVATLTLGSSTFSSDALPTLDRLVDAINATSDWTARLLGPLVGVRTEDLPAQTVALSGGKAVISLQGKAYEYALANSAIAKAQAAAGNPSALAWTFFSGGSEGPTPTVADWLAALARAESLDVHGVVVGTGDLAVLAAAAGHVNAMSDAKNRKERLLYCGPGLQASKAALMDAAKEIVRGLGGSRVVVVAAEPRLVDARTNRLTVYPSFYTAAMLAGMKAGNRPEMPFTNKELSIFGLSYEYSTEDLEDLLENGVVPVHFDPARNKYVVTQGITSYTRDANVIYRKIAGMDIADYLNKKIRLRLQRYIGRVGDQLTIKQILNSVVGLLQEEVRGPNNPDGVLTDGIDPQTGQPTPAFRNVEVVMDGFDAVGVRYEAHPVGEIAYILATAYLTPVRIVARA
nr:phage tail sheath subtilisin-like domain-containing protein [Thermus brevis]